MPRPPRVPHRRLRILSILLLYHALSLPCRERPCTQLSPQAKQSRSFYNLVLIGAAACAAVFGLHDLDVDSPQVMGQRSSKPSARGIACPPQWLPVLMGAKHDLPSLSSSCTLTSTESCQQGDVVLYAPTQTGPNIRGLLLTWYNNNWGAVCDDVTDCNDPIGGGSANCSNGNVNVAGGENLAAVVCRSLGNTGGEDYNANGASSGYPTVVYGTENHITGCAGTEELLSECKWLRYGSWHNCGHEEDVGVACVGTSHSPSPPPPYVFTTKASLQTAVLAYDANPTAATTRYGPIADWDVSSITDMTQLFHKLRYFNADISSWDTSSVTDMSYMFDVRFRPPAPSDTPVLSQLPRATHTRRVRC